MHAFMTKQLRINEQMVDRLAQRWARVVMKQTLVDWKKIIIRKKYTRVLLEKTSGRWSKQRLLRLFRRWATFAAAEKLRKTKLQLTHFHENRLDFQDLLVKLEQQIESAKLETRTNREHVDFAKRQLLGLGDLLHQLDLRVRQSNERKLQHIVNQWGRLCFALVDCEVLHLQNMLDAVPWTQYVDVSMLATKGEELSELLNLPSDVLVLRWINFQLAQCGTFRYYSATSPSGFVQNFTTDMRSHYVLRHILQRLITVNAKDAALRRMSTFVSRRDGGAAPDPIHAKVPAPFARREDLRAALSDKLDPGCPAFLSDQVLESDVTGDLMFCLFAFLVCEHPSLSTATGPVVSAVSASPRRPTTTSSSSAPTSAPGASGVASSGPQLDPACPWQDAQVALNDARALWETVRLQWTELQTPFEIQENTKTTPDVTSPPHLLLKANGALQNAVNMVQYACSKRSCILKIWGCVQRKVQQDALRLLLRRGRKELPLVLMDRRAWREKYMLTTLHVSRLVAQLTAHESSSKENSEHRHYEHKLPASRELLETELLEVEPVLEEHYEALRRVYRYYAAIEHTQDPTSGVTGSAPPHDVPGATVASGAGAQHASLHHEDEEERFFHKIAVSMSLLEFHALLKDCRVFGTTRPFPYAFILQVFEQVNAHVAATTGAAVLAAPGQSTVASTSVDDRSYADNNASEMTPGEFVEALVHIARSKYVCFKRTSGVHLTLAQRVRKCLQEIILPRAMQEKDHENVFRPLVLTAECREIIAKHQKKLAALYTRFANGASGALGGETPRHPQHHAPSSGSARMLSVMGFVALCRHFELIREHFLNLDDVQHVLAEILQLERESVVVHTGDATGVAVSYAAATASGGHEQSGHASPAAMPLSGTAGPGLDHSHAADELFLTYAEFVEALAAIACYLRPDAFVPLATKIDEFCLQELHFGFAA